MKKRPIPCIALLALLAQCGVAGDVPVSLLFEARATAHRAAQWLVQRQREDGSWSRDSQLTAAAVVALCGSGYAKTEKVAQAAARATAWLADADGDAAARTPTSWELACRRAEALAACEAVGLPLPKSLADWRGRLLAKLLETQQGNGCWQERGQDSEVATSHALRALAIAGGSALGQVP